MYNESIEKEEKNIPAKTFQEMHDFSGLLKNRSFDQRDIELMLIKSRDFIPKGYLLEEIGNFIAHPERNQGTILEEIEYNIKRVESSKYLKSFDERVRIEDIKIPPFLYEYMKQYYRYEEPLERVLEKIDKVTERKENHYEVVADLSSYTRGRLLEPIRSLDKSEIDIPITHKYIYDELSWLLENIGIYPGDDVFDEAKKEFLICVLCTLHGCTYFLDDEVIAQLYLGFRSSTETTYDKRLATLFYTSDPEFGEPFFSPIISTNINIKHYLGFDIDEEWKKSNGISAPMDLVKSVRNPYGEIVLDRIIVESDQRKTHRS